MLQCQYKMLKCYNISIKYVPMLQYWHIHMVTSKDWDGLAMLTSISCNVTAWGWPISDRYM
jgi:hypothetical protein